ncbi:MAG: hypothetical protein ACLQE9_21040 [Roseiarcus sp.]
MSAKQTDEGRRDADEGRRDAFFHNPNEAPMKDFFVHLGAQVAVAAGTAAMLTLAHANYSDLGVYAGVAQAGAAMLAETWNQFFPSK